MADVLDRAPLIGSDEFGNFGMDVDNLDLDNGNSDGGSSRHIVNNTWDSDGQNSNGDGGGGNVQVFYFNDGEAPQQHVRFPTNLGCYNDGPSVAQFSASQGLRCDKDGAFDNPIGHTN